MLLIASIFILLYKKAAAPSCCIRTAALPLYRAALMFLEKIFLSRINPN